jgi:hypothetical protein
MPRLALLAAALILGGCVMPPTASEGQPSNIVYVVCVAWSSCAADEGTSGATSKEGGASVAPLDKLVTPPQPITIEPVPIEPIPLEPLG